MGTRGTLHVYVNGELKIRQYNQWDSYPTGQFQNICYFFRGPTNLEGLTHRLLNTRFCTKKEVDAIREPRKGKHLEDKTLESWLWILTDRDWGADILWTIASSPSSLKVIPDWAVTDEDYINQIEGGLKGDRYPPQEGNYVIEIECKVANRPEGYTKRIESGTTPRFRLSGEYHGIKHEYDWDYIPTEEECEAWEKEAISAYAEKDSA